MTENKQLVESLADALRAAGFTGLEKRFSSGSVTVSAHKGSEMAVVHIEDTSVPLRPHEQINTDRPDPTEIVVRPQVPGASGMSSSSGGAPAPIFRKSASR